MNELIKRVETIIEDVYGIEDELDIENVVAELGEIKEKLEEIEELEE